MERILFRSSTKEKLHKTRRDDYKKHKSNELFKRESTTSKEIMYKNTKQRNKLAKPKRKKEKRRKLRLIICMI